MTQEHAKIAKVASLLRESKQAIAFTGAGISTESGVPDFRSPGGVWSKYQPVLFQEFLSSEEARRRYWQIKREGYYEMRNARPNHGHRVLARLETAGKIAAIITQNIDGLHHDAGSRNILELHGTSRYCICLKCNQRFDSDSIQQRLEAGLDIPLCDQCGGFIKSATVSFGQALPPQILAEAFDLCLHADLLLAIGSSLVVEPAASLPLQAKQHGARLVIINRDETPLDAWADVVVRTSIGDSLLEIARRLGYELPR
jgi:NAD-dependent deacetylase